MSLENNVTKYKWPGVPYETFVSPIKYVVVVEFHAVEDTPKVFGPFESRLAAQEWLYTKAMELYGPHDFARQTIQILEEG